ncbi:MAG: KpsF/GutQ family sugar-phosphate isomerase, partial [Verrucomicrobiia bacterium]
MMQQQEAMQPLDRAKWVIRTESEELLALEQRLSGDTGAAFLQAVQVLRRTLDQRGKVIVLGVGKSGHIGAKIAATLTSTGSRAVVMNSLDALHGDLGIVSDGDCVLALSYSGETEELTAILPALRRFQITLIALTGRADSTLAQWSDVVLLTPVTKEACPLGLAPTSSTTSMLALGDALAMVLLEVRGFQSQDFARFHPSGRLGRRLLLKVADVMREPARAAAMPATSTVSDGLREMTSKRCGAVVLLAHDGKVTGIFTQGDFARRYQENPLIGELTLDQVMTRNPVTIAASAPAVELLKVFESRRIDDVIVID